MRGGRLKIVNESSYPDDEVERCVRFGLSEIDLTGSGVVAVVKHTAKGPRRQPRYSGVYWGLTDAGIPSGMYDDYFPRRNRVYEHLIVMRVGPPAMFPMKPYTGRFGRAIDFRTWQEALVAITGHEGKHAEHENDGAYRKASGRRRPAMFTDATGRSVPFRCGGSLRVGSERIEPKCDAWEDRTLRRWREQTDVA